MNACVLPCVFLFTFYLRKKDKSNNNHSDEDQKRSKGYNVKLTNLLLK